MRGDTSPWLDSPPADPFRKVFVTDLTVPPVSAAILADAERLLLAPSGLDQTKLSAVLASIHSHDVSFADLYFQHARFESWSLEEGIVKSGTFSIDRGVGVRAVAGDKQAYAYSDDISLTALDEEHQWRWAQPLERRAMIDDALESA